MVKLKQELDDKNRLYNKKERSAIIRNAKASRYVVYTWCYLNPLETLSIKRKHRDMEIKTILETKEPKRENQVFSQKILFPLIIKSLIV